MSTSGTATTRLNDPLPWPDGGWPHMIRSVTAVTGLWAIAAFAIAALLLPKMDPQCYSTETAHICPLDADPELTHLFDAAWPRIPEIWALVPAFVAMLLAIGIAMFIDTREPWSGTGGAPAVVGLLCGLAGWGAGFVVAGPGFSRPLIAAAISGVGILLLVTAFLGARSFRRVLRRNNAAHLRRTHLRAHGTRTIATVTAFQWLKRWQDDDPVFEVTALFGTSAGRRSVTEELCVPKALAPVTGGTVIVLHDDALHHPTGISVLLEADPDGIRDPDAERAYPDKPEGSPS